MKNLTFDFWSCAVVFVFFLLFHEFFSLSSSHSLALRILHSYSVHCWGVLKVMLAHAKAGGARRQKREHSTVKSDFWTWITFTFMTTFCVHFMLAFVKAGGVRWQKREHSTVKKKIGPSDSRSRSWIHFAFTFTSCSHLQKSVASAGKNENIAQ